MSKAFQCDNCLECFPGEPEKVIDRKDLCYSCVRVLKVLGAIDPVAHIKLRQDRPGDWEQTESPLHTGQHSF